MKLDGKEVNPKDVPLGPYWARYGFMSFGKLETECHVAQISSSLLGTACMTLPRFGRPGEYYDCPLHLVSEASKGTLELVSIQKPEGW